MRKESGYPSRGRGAAPLTIVGADAATLDRWNVLAVVDAQHMRMASLCDQLEGIADTLPHAIDPVQCMSMARTLVPTMKAVAAFEEQELLPLAESILGPDIHDGSLQLLMEQQHREDMGYAEELSESLADRAMTATTRGANSLGYMLRGFFYGMRRHIAFEHYTLVEPLKARRACLDG